MDSFVADKVFQFRAAVDLGVLHQDAVFDGSTF